MLHTCQTHRIVNYLAISTTDYSRGARIFRTSRNYLKIPAAT